MEDIITKQYKKLWYALKIEKDDKGKEICRELGIYNTQKKCIYDVHTYEDEKKYLKDSGELTMYDYDAKENKVVRMKQEEFINKYCDKDSSFGRQVWDILKLSLASYGKEGSFLGNIYQDEDTVYSYVKDNAGKNCFIFGLNLNEQKAQKYLENEINEYIKITMKDEGELFQLYSEHTTYISVSMKKVLKQQDGIDLCKGLVDVCKNKNITLNGIKNIEKGLGLYSSYKKLVDKWNSTVEELKKEWKKFTFNGTKIQKMFLMTEEDKKIYDGLNKKLWDVEPIGYRDSDYSQYCNFVNIITKLKNVADNYSELYNKQPLTLDVPGDFI